MVYRYCLWSLAVAFTLLTAGTAQAQITVASDGGNWDDPNTWSTGAVPTASDDVVIDSTVSINIANAEARNVTVTGEAGELRYERDPSLAGFGLTVHGDLVIEGPDAELRPLSQEDPDTGVGYGIVYHRLTVYGNIDNSTGGTFDMRRGATSTDPPTAAFVDLIFEGSDDSVVTLGEYDNNTNQLFIRKTDGGRVVLGNDVTQDNNSLAKLHLESGNIVTNEYRWRVWTNSSSGVVGGSPNSYVIGALSRGIPQSGDAYERVYPVGDENGYRPVTIYSSDLVPDDQDFEVRVIAGDADPGSATLENGLMDISPVRYYAFTMFERDTGDPYTVDRIAISYGPDDGVPEGSSEFVVATSVAEDRSVWRNSGGFDPDTGSPHVTTLAAPPTLVQSGDLADFTFEITLEGDPPTFVQDTYYAAIGTTEAFVTSTEETTLPDGFILSAVYPNPFRGTAALSLEVPRPVEARVQVYDLLGREVATLADGYLTPGSHTFRWDGAQAPAGLYFIRVETDTFTATRKVNLLR
ncbi:MAG: hypothetical protein KatS3mg082_3122 [Nitrospiraceae bacterium]|nr:MAG: hypothetical protein KatS3mg082_3122 [Nitrospiraceae bacterium]